MKLYAVFQQGIYRHECVGIFSTYQKAIDVARFAQDKEPDSWHHYEVVPFRLDETNDITQLTPTSWLNIVEEQALFITQKG